MATCTRFNKLLRGIILGLAVLAAAANGQQKTCHLNSADGLDLINAKAEATDYRSRHAVRLVPVDHKVDSDSMFAVLPDSNFKNGSIEVDIAGAPRKGTPQDSRGFIGIAFRMSDANRFECLYLRPTNARADDQLRRNHTVQYVSAPDFPWERLRKENPGMYESYVDLEPGAWTRVKIVVAGTHARLFVNGAQEPCLIVNDLKLGETEGRIALWSHITTDGYFSELTVK